MLTRRQDTTIHRWIEAKSTEINVLGASQAAVFLNFLPVATMIGAYLFLAETITAAQILGAGLVIGGMLLTTRRTPFRSRPG